MDEYVAIEASTAEGLESFNVTEYVTSPSSTDFISSTGNDTASLGHVMRDADKQRIIIIAIIMAFTIIGNMTLILVLLCKRSRRIKRVNILLLNLAFGDLAVAMFVNTTEILFLAFGDWALGPIMCKIVVYVQMICLSSATNLLTAMSIDRYQVIVKPMQSLARRPRIWLKIAIAWILSFLFPIPQLFIFVQYNQGLKFDGTPRRFCGSNGYTAPWQRKVYFTFTTVYILVVPMAIMLYCYTKIIQVVWIRAKHETYRRPSSPSALPPPMTSPASLTTPKNSSDSGGEKHEDTGQKCKVGCGCVDKSKEKEGGKTQSVRWARNVKESKDTNDNAQVNDTKLKPVEDEDLNLGSPRMSVRRSLVTASKRRALIMTLTVVMSFLVCHTPYFIVNLVRIFSDYQVRLERVKIMSEFMVMVHSTLNPLLYGLFTLRQYHLKYLIALITCSRRPASPKSLRTRQYSDERHKLLSSVRSRLIHHNSNTGASTVTTTTTTSNSNKKNKRHKHHHHHHHNHKAAAPASKPLSLRHTSVSSTSTSSSSSTSFFNRLRRGQLRPFSRKNRRRRQQENALLFTNKDAIHLTCQSKSRPEETEISELESSPLSPKDYSPGTFIANTHTIKSNGSSPTLHNCCRPEMRLQGGCDDKSAPSLTNDNCNATKNAVIPWTPQDDEFMIGGLTRV